MHTLHKHTAQQKREGHVCARHRVQRHSQGRDGKQSIAQASPQGTPTGHSPNAQLQAVLEAAELELL